MQACTRAIEIRAVIAREQRPSGLTIFLSRISCVTVRDSNLPLGGFSPSTSTGALHGAISREVHLSRRPLCDTTRVYVMLVWRILFFA